MRGEGGGVRDEGLGLREEGGGVRGLCSGAAVFRCSIRDRIGFNADIQIIFVGQCSRPEEALLSNT